MTLHPCTLCHCGRPSVCVVWFMCQRRACGWCLRSLHFGCRLHRSCSADHAGEEGGSAEIVGASSCRGGEDGDRRDSGPQRRAGDRCCPLTSIQQPATGGQGLPAVVMHAGRCCVTRWRQPNPVSTAECPHWHSGVVLQIFLLPHSVLCLDGSREMTTPHHSCRAGRR